MPRATRNAGPRATPSAQPGRRMLARAIAPNTMSITPMMRPPRPPRASDGWSGAVHVDPGAVQWRRVPSGAVQYGVAVHPPASGLPPSGLVPGGRAPATTHHRAQASRADRAGR